jgi:hypothetical protein
MAAVTGPSIQGGRDKWPTSTQKKNYSSEIAFSIVFQCDEEYLENVVVFVQNFGIEIMQIRRK